MNKQPNFSSLFYLSPFPQWVFDINTLEILDVNEVAIQHYGYSKVEFLQLTIKNLLPEEEINLVSYQIVNEPQNGNINFGVFTLQKKSGEKISIKINGHILHFLDRKCVMLICQDDTEQKESEQHLRKISEQLIESESKFRTIFEIASLGIVQVDPSKGQIILVNSFYETITGYTNEELLKMNFVELTHPDDREKDWEIFSKAMRGEVEYRNEKRYIKKDGTVVWVRVHIAFIRNDEGKTIRTLAICEDINSRKEEEQRLKLLESVITNTKDAILITEAEPFDEPGNRIIYVNEAFTKMTGYTAEEVIGKTPRILQGPNTDKKELGRIGKALRSWESCECTVINYKKNGEEFWINFAMTPVANEMGWYTHWIAIERDVTEQTNIVQRKELLSKISLDFRIENDLFTSANDLCDTISSFGKFDFVELWLPNVEYTQIQLFAHKLSSSNAEVFYEISKDVKSIDLGKDLVDAVWLKKSSKIWEAFDKNNGFIRKDAAEKAGIKTALGIPLLWAEKVVGLLVIGTRHKIGYLKKHLKVFEQLKRFIGSEISRKKLENDLQHLYEAIPDILCLGDLQGRVLKINKAGCELLGYEEEELLFHYFDEFVHPDDKEISTNEVLKLGEGQSVFNFENRYITKNGDIVWLSWTCSSSLEEGLIYATAKNITEEKKLMELNRQVNSLAKIGYWEVDLIRGKLFWSDIVHELHETDPKSFVPDLESAINFYREDFREKVQSSVEKCIQTGEAFDFEAILVTANGKERWVRAIGSAEITDGVCKSIYGGFQDIQERKVNEIALQNSLKTLEAYKYALEQSAIIAITDKNGVITEVNDYFCRISKYSKEELIGTTHRLINSKHHPKEFFVDLWKTISSGEVWREETKNLAKDGTYYWLDTTISPFLDEKNIPYQYLAIRFDITKRKLAEKKVFKTLEEKTNILESVGDAFFSVNTDWIVTYWNRVAEETIGVKRELLIGKNLWEVFPEATSLPSYKNYHQAMATGETINFEEYNTLFNKWFDVSAYPAKEGLTVYFRDVTLRKQADIRLHQANERFEKATEATNDAIWDWNIVDNELYWGGNIRNQLGYDLGHTAPTLDSWANLIHPDEKAWVVQSIQEVLDNADQTNWIAEYRYQKFDGTYADVVDRGVVIRDDNGKAIRMVGAMTNISERKSFEKQLLGLNKSLEKHAHELELSNQKLKDIAWTQSHVVRAPLARILGIINVIEEKQESLEDIYSWLKHLRNSTNEMDDVVKKIVNEAQTLK